MHACARSYAAICFAVAKDAGREAKEVKEMLDLIERHGRLCDATRIHHHAPSHKPFGCASLTGACGHTATSMARAGSYRAMNKKNWGRQVGY